MQYQIVGDNLPVALFRLEPGETIISEAGGRAWYQGDIKTETKGGGLGKALGRALTAESFFMSHYTAQGPAEIAFTSCFPGSIVVKELAAGQSVLCQKSAFLCATAGVNISIQFQKKLGAGFFGGEGFILQKITGPGLAFFEIDGYCHRVPLQAGEQLVCDTGVVALMDETCDLDIKMVSGLKNAMFGGEGLFDTVITGPGEVALQSMSRFAMAALVQEAAQK